MSTKHAAFFQALAAPFHPSEVKQLKKGKMIKYVTARTVMNRLDEVVGPENWWDDYIPGAESVICRLTITLPDGKEITKVDAGGYAGMADSGDDDKSGFSDAFKRAAVKFGVSRYLYEDGVPIFPEEQAPAPDPHPVNESTPPADWFGYISDRSAEAQARWVKDMEAANVDPTLRAHPDYQMPGVHEVNNHFVSHALKSGAIKQEDVAKAGKPGVRDSGKCKAALADIYRRAPAKVRERVEDYLLQKEQSLRVKLGMDDLDEVAGVNIDAEEVAQAGREPGCDDD